MTTPLLAQITTATAAASARRIIEAAGPRPKLTAVRERLAATLGETGAREVWQSLTASGAIRERSESLAVPTVHMRAARVERFVAAERAAEDRERVAVNYCDVCGESADPHAPAVLASGLRHPVCAHPEWSASLVASAAPGELDALALRLYRARRVVSAASKAQR